MYALIVEDEPKAATFLFTGLSENGWAVDVAGDGSMGLEFLQEKTYDVVLLDVLLPGCDGWSVIRQRRCHACHFSYRQGQFGRADPRFGFRRRRLFGKTFCVHGIDGAHPHNFTARPRGQS